jgi:hypothetical protein
MEWPTTDAAGAARPATASTSETIPVANASSVSAGPPPAVNRNAPAGARPTANELQPSAASIRRGNARMATTTWRKATAMSLRRAATTILM